MNRTNRRNTDLSNANLQRKVNSDEFALNIVQRLEKVEEGLTSDQKDLFKSSLKIRSEVLNRLKIKTRRGKKWSCNSVKRVVERVENLRNSTK